MLTWTLAHPWLTFWLSLVALLVLDNAIDLAHAAIASKAKK